MPSPAVLDVEPLLAPINDDEPAGSRMPILDRNKLKELREDFDPDRDLSEEERQNPQFSEKQKVVPQWDKVIAFGTQFLQKTGKDLTVALALVEALTRRHKFAGLRDGLRLLARTCDECWDRMHPVIEDADDPDEVEGRVSPFAFIDDEDKTPFFPNSVRGLALLSTPDGEPVSYLAMKSFGGQPAKVSQDDFRTAVASAGPDAAGQIQTMDEDIEEALTELQALVSVLDSKAGSNAPGLGGLRKAILDCQTLTKEALRLRGGGAAAQGEAEADEQTSSGGGGYSPGGGGSGMNLGSVRSRDDVYARLNELTGLLETIDPHSPVPFLIRRAMEMRDMKFPELVDRLTAAKPMVEFLRSPLSEQGGTPEG